MNNKDEKSSIQSLKSTKFKTMLSRKTTYAQSKLSEILTKEKYNYSHSINKIIIKYI